MDLLEALYRRRLRKKQKKTALGRSDGALCRSPSETSVNRIATGLLSRVLRFTTRSSEPASRPHSWHSTKLGGGGPDSSQLEELSPGGPDTQHTPWHHGYNHPHASVSTTELCVGWDSGPDQYSSRGSLDSLDPPPPSQSRAEPMDPPLDHRDHQPTPTHSSTRSSNSMDLLHNKRDSAYSSLSTSSSIPECLASAPSLSSERCYSLESVPQRGREGEGCYSLESVSQRGREGEVFRCSELTSTASLSNSLSQERGVSQQGPEGRGGVQGSKRHSVGPIWGPTAGRSSSDGLKEAPAPPHRTDSFTATRTHERPNSWSSLDHARSLRSLHKGSWHHSSGSVAPAKGSGSYAADVQLHTVVEKSPESSPTTKPRQGGAFPQPGPPNPGAPHGGPVPPTSYPLPSPSQGPSQGHPALGARETLHQLQQDLGARDGGEDEVNRCGNGENSCSSPSQPHWSASSSSSSSSSSFSPLRSSLQEAHRAEDHHQVSPRVAQGQVVPCPHPQPGPPGPQPWDQAQQVHPLTRLEMALAEIQRCAGPDSALPATTDGVSQATTDGVSQSTTDGVSQSTTDGVSQATTDGVSQSTTDGVSQANNGGTQGSGRRLSVLEKVSRFERREHGVKQRSLSSRSYSLKYKREPGPAGQSSPCGAEDLRNMLQRSGTKAQRTMSYRSWSSDHTQHRFLADPSAVLLRSQSTFHLGDPQPEEIDQHHLFPDNAFSSSYRDSLKDAQSKVLSSTSFRRRDLHSSLAPPVPVLHHHTTTTSSASSSSSSSPGPPSASRQDSLEKRGPETKPKPQQAVLTSSCTSLSSPPPVPSPHTPRERRTVSPHALPGVPPVGPPPLGRVCGRRRLSVQQKKRSYSEPDSMHEVGVSDPETTALFRRGGESSVADRRRMFEGTTHSSSLGGDGTRPQNPGPHPQNPGPRPQSPGPRPQNPGPRPQSPGPHPPVLRQAQQDALAQYIQRKRSGMRDQERPQRPYSACLQPDTESSSPFSYQESCPDWTVLPGEGWLSSPLPPGAHSNTSAPRPVSSRTEPAPPPHLHAGAQHLTPARGSTRLPPDQGLSRQVHGALQRAESIRSTSAAGDLLEEREASDRHNRCLSTPPKTMTHLQDVRNVPMTTLPAAKAPKQPDRPMNTQTQEGHAPYSDPSLHQCQGAGESHPPVTRRERPHISSPLAASVGLPCLSPPPHPFASSPTLRNTVKGGVTEETVPLLPSTQRRRSSVRMSEPSLLSLSQPSEICGSQSAEDLDSVFFTLPPPPPPIRESGIVEHLPPPQQVLGGGTRTHGDNPVTTETTASVNPSPQPSVPGGLTSPGPHESLGIKYLPLPKREVSAQELRAQALLGTLVLRDRSLAPVLDTLGSKRTIELMEDVFHGSGLAGKSPWQHRGGGGNRSVDRVQDVGSPGGVDSLETNPHDECNDLDVLKVELCDALRRSVEALQEEMKVFQEELLQHRALGASLEVVVQNCCRPNERDKYRVFIGDLEKVVSLLLSLSGRLARTEAALYDLEDRQDDCIEEKASLLLKRSQLRSQWEDARELKENVERRQHVVHALLSGHMTPAQLLLYRRLVAATPSLLIRQRHLKDLIRRDEERAVLIKETLPPHLAGEPDWPREFQLSSRRGLCLSQPTPPGSSHPALITAVTSL